MTENLALPLPGHNPVFPALGTAEFAPARNLPARLLGEGPRPLSPSGTSLVATETALFTSLFNKSRELQLGLGGSHAELV